MTAQFVAKVLAFVLYLGFMIFIGLRNASKNNSSADFFLGGRKVGPWVTALSAEASDSSAWLLMGLPGLCYLGGVQESFWTAIGLILGTYLSWLFVAKPLRKCSITFGDSITIPEFLSKRFNDKSHLLSVVSVIFIVLFFTIYTASGFVACAKLFNSVFGINYHAGLAIGLVVILCYTITGGYTAVCTTDFVQGSLIFIAFVISTVVAVFAIGGTSQAVNVFNNFSEVAGTELQAFNGMGIVSALAWGLGYFGMPHIIVRFMGIRSNGEIKKARRIGISWMVVSYIGAILIGTLGTVYLKNHGITLDSVSAETVFSATMQQMYPAFIAGIFLCAILAASMSTADSQLLAASSAVSQDIFKGLIKKDAEEKEVLNISRFVVFVIALIALLLSLNPNSSIFSLVSFAWSGFGGTFGPLILLALYWKRTTAPGAIAGLICGGITDVIWHYIPASVAPIFGLYEIVPAFLACLIVTVIVSLCTRVDSEVETQFQQYKTMAD